MSFSTPFIDYYAILGVRPLATTKEIRKRFEDLAIQAVEIPLVDESANDAGELIPRYDILCEAWKILSDHATRGPFHLAYEEHVLEQHRRILGIPRKIEKSLTEWQAPRDAIIYWIDKLRFGMQRLLWYRFDRIVKILESPVVDLMIFHEFNDWQEDARKCYIRLDEIKREVEMKGIWEEKDWAELDTAKEVKALKNCVISWLELADRVLEYGEMWFDKDGEFLKPEDWQESAVCTGKLCEVMMWEEFRVAHSEIFRRKN